jgi:NADH pyrophosphatase NudC (nudix superfamily)
MDYHFCPHCGAATIKREDGGRIRDACPSCEWVHYSEMAIGVGAIIPRGDAVLLVQRGIPPVGLWTLPSGWIEQEDTLETAVVREVQEETGLLCTPQGILCIRSYPKPLRNETYVCFLCTVPPDVEPVADGIESLQARFVTPTEYSDLDISPFTLFLLSHYARVPAVPLPASRAFDDYDVYPNAAIFAPF